VGRFTLAANALTLTLYVPYFYRDLRFLMLPVALNHVCAAVAIARGLSPAGESTDRTRASRRGRIWATWPRASKLLFGPRDVYEPSRLPAIEDHCLLESCC
jgi:hypothetical protein